MPRKKKTGSLSKPKPKDSKQQTKGRAVKQVKRAIEKTKPPKPKLTISKHADKASRQQVARRIRKLEIIQDITTWIRTGYPDLEIARRIHDQGFLEDVALRTLTKDIMRYRTQVMSPAEVASGQFSQGVLDAAKQIEEGRGELAELETDYQGCRKRLARLDAIVGDFIGLAERVVGYQGDLPLEAQEGAKNGNGKAKGDEVRKTGGAWLVDELRDAWGFDKITWKPPAEIALMTREDAVRYLLTSGPAMKQVQDVMKEANTLVAKMTDILIASANIKDAMGLLHADGPSDSTAVLEAELTQVVIRKYPGDVAMQDALLNPQKRAKALALLKKVMTNRRLQAGPPIDTAAEPVTEGEA